MLKIVFFTAFVALLCYTNIEAQFSKAEIDFLNTPFKVQLVGDALKGVRTDGKPYTFGLPSVKAFLQKFSSKDKIDNNLAVSLVHTGGNTIYDLCSNGSPVTIWQDPNTPDNIHAVYAGSPLGDGQTFPNRRSKCLFSYDRGATWSFVADVPDVRSGFPSITGFSDGTPLIVNQSTDGGGVARSQAYKDYYPGLGSFTRLDAPGNNAYVWPRAVATGNLSLTNKFIMLASISGNDTTKYNVNTNLNSTPGSWLGWTAIPAEQAEAYAIARGTGGRIGIVFKNDDNRYPNSYADVWFMESTNNGTSFSAPYKIYDADFSPSGDSLGCMRGISIVYQGSYPAVAFETIKQGNGLYFPMAPSKIRFWSPLLAGTDPNRSIVAVDSSRVGYIPYIGVNDVMAPICRPSIGVSANGNVLFVAFNTASANTGGTVTPTSFMNIWLMYSTDYGANWYTTIKLNPVSPIKDWRYVNISPTNDFTGSTYSCNMLALRGHIPGSYVLGFENGESLEEIWSIRYTGIIYGSYSPPPCLNLPLNNTVVSVTPYLLWNDSTVGSYTLQVSANSGFTNNLIDLAGLTNPYYQVPSGVFQQGTTYYWRVKTGSSNWSAVWTFTTLGVPPIPYLLTPLNGSEVFTLMPTCDWSDVPNAVSYTFQSATDSAFTNIIVNTGTGISQYTYQYGILSGLVSYYWRVRGENGSGAGPWSARWKFTVSPTGIEPYSSEIPKEFKLYNNYPNPFNPVTLIKYDIAKNTNVKLTVYDVTGREAATLVNENLRAGRYEAVFNGSNYSSGVYFAKIEAGTYTHIIKLLMVK